MTTLLTPAEARTAVELLASRPLIRLITEIDDNGPIPPRRLASTLPDLSAHQLRRAGEAARTYHLVQAEPGANLELTASGAELADLYDATARWSRHHAYPAAVSEFSTRIGHVLDLLAPSLTNRHTDGLPRPAAPLLPSGEAELELARPRSLLLQWLAANPQVTQVPEAEPEPAA
ncbi:regulator [Streptomyces sp. 8L]|uniref:regulator n=1 Tax=Streptomyces sp. 8L TaxID=2877242 RepID=UPI001CD52E42|nr:regulator [Streptomyces sp. 8L]MCA1221967.1 regulator [Streptomyces sp. 8L]